MDNNFKDNTTWDLPDEVLKGLEEQGVVEPTDIQREVIPIALGHGEIGRAHV